MMIHDDNIKSLVVAVTDHSKKKKEILESTLPRLQEVYNNCLAQVNMLAEQLDRARAKLDASRKPLEETLAALSKLNQLPEIVKVLEE